jgi:hypothetical protein
MEPKGFMGCLKKCIACELSSSGHEKYPSDSPNQNNHNEKIVFVITRLQLDRLVAMDMIFS